jgi:hypothetical protein
MAAADDRTAYTLVRGRLGVGGLASGAAAGVACLAALGQDLGLLDPVLPIGAARLPELRPDALDVAAHPGGDLLVACDAELAEGIGERRIDALDAGQILRGLNGRGSWCRGLDGSRFRDRWAGLGGWLDEARGSALHHLGQRVDASLGCCRLGGRTMQRPASGAGDDRAEQVCPPHQQQRLQRQRDHYDSPRSTVIRWAAQGPLFSARLQDSQPTIRPSTNEASSHQMSLETRNSISVSSTSARLARYLIQVLHFGILLRPHHKLDAPVLGPDLV